MLKIDCQLRDTIQVQMIPEEVLQRERGEKVKIIQEIWVDCFFDKDYQVSNLGGVKRVSKIHKKTRERMPIKTILPYLYDRYWETSISGKSYALHKVIYYSFFPEEYVYNRKDMAIDHINGVKLDCRLVNLKLIPWSVNSDKGNKDWSGGLF